jgi:hypothetical protein
MVLAAALLFGATALAPAWAEDVVSPAPAEEGTTTAAAPAPAMECPMGHAACGAGCCMQGQQAPAGRMHRHGAPAAGAGCCCRGGAAPEAPGPAK